jgi:hypothetical protein
MQGSWICVCGLMAGWDDCGMDLPTAVLLGAVAAGLLP